jgi:5'-3' exonuclease
LAPFFPSKLEVIADPKGRAWKDVLKIPFIDEKILLEVESSVSKDLTEDEKRRNSFGAAIEFSFDTTSTTAPLPSAFASNYGNFKKMTCKVEKHHPFVLKSRFEPIPHPNYNPKDPLPVKNHPTLRTLQFTCQAKKVGIKSMGHASW